jgi:hypothetical protein
MLTLKRLDIFETIENMTHSQIWRALILPTPPFQRARTHSPTPRQLNLIEVMLVPFLSLIRHAQSMSIQKSECISAE